MSRTPKRKEFLTKEQILDVLKKLDARARALGVQYAVIGGALFKLLDIPGYETTDIDVAASDYLDLPPVPPYGDKPSFCPLGHYRVNGISIDWMPSGKKGSEELFADAIRHSVVSKDGIWLAPLSHAVAIKVYAGRVQDKDVFDAMLNDGLVEDAQVRGLIDAYCNPIGDNNE